MAGPPIDLRSDTVTHPTAEMRRAMSTAEVGDDVYGEDPTVRALEERAAELMGKEAALYTTSGTLANQLALKVWTRPGEQVILSATSHIVLFEPAGLALISNAVANPIPGEEGWFGAGEVEARLDAQQLYGSLATGLVCVENTHNRAGGKLFPEAKLATVSELCRRRHIPVHMDGARIFNAAAAAGRPAAELATSVDSVMFCLSKGLACPVGSVLCGPRDFIEEARQVRQILGGGMRQAGIIAAAGLVALETMVDRLAEDHRRARRLAEGLAQLPGVRLDAAGVVTNIVIFDLAEADAADLCRRLASRGVLAFPIGPRRIRMVTHYQVGEREIETALEAVGECLRETVA